MHLEVREWLEELRSDARQQHPEAFECASVLECGSYNVNGAVRDLFTAGEYVGLAFGVAAGAGRGRGQSGARQSRISRAGISTP